jgi:lipopolysaccharide transport system permease protein
MFGGPAPAAPARTLDRARDDPRPPHDLTVYADLLRYRELFANLFRRDLHARYKGSALGVVWSLANPLVLMAVYALVFSIIWQAAPDGLTPYPLFLLSGIVVWVFFAGSLQAAARSMVDSAPLIRKTRFPRQLVPLSMVGTQLVGLAAMLLVLLPLNFVLLPETRGTLWLALPLALPVIALAAGLALAIASLNVVFRDVEHLVSALLLPWFFLTPILYTRESLPGGEYGWIVDVLHWVNFVAPAVAAVRDPLFFGRLPQVGDVVYLVVAALLALGLGSWVFNRVDDRIAVEL